MPNDEVTFPEKREESATHSHSDAFGNVSQKKNFTLARISLEVVYQESKTSLPFHLDRELWMYP